MIKVNKLREALAAKDFVKVIAGINNFDLNKVKNVVIAADKGNASAVDIAARQDIIELAQSLTDLPIFVSSVDPQELKIAADCGADALEIGNFDKLYHDGLRISAKEVLDITGRTIALVGNDVFLSVTVPGHIDINEQIQLAQDLEYLGVDLIQTEGAAIANVQSAGARGLLETAQVSIANTIELVKNVDIPVMTASGISVITAPLAFAAGASGIGVGSCVNKLNSTIEMIATVKSIMDTVKSEEKAETVSLGQGCPSLGRA